MQRWRHSGDKKDWGDWIVLTIPATMDEEGIKSACESLNAATSNMQDFLNLGDGNQSEHYKIVFQIDDVTLHERAFFQEAVKFKELRPLIAQYVDNVNHEPDTWQDEYHPRGSFAIAELTLADESYIPSLAKRFSLWDLGHETYQEKLIDQLLVRYGYTDTTEYLLAARLCADGQHIDENIWRALYRYGFKDKIDFSQFVKLVLQLSTFPEAGWHLEKFCQLYAGRDQSAYSLAISTALNILRNDELHSPFAEGFQNKCSDEFREHWLMDADNGDSNDREGDWNAGLENALIEESDFTKMELLHTYSQ